MTKLSESDYFLPKIEALEFVEELSSGSNKPVLIKGLCTNTQEENDYVVKLLSSERMRPEAFLRELIANLIAQELDLTLPEAVTVNISPEFANTLKGKSHHQRVSESLGLNFGSQYLSGVQQPAKDFEFTKNLLVQAAEVFAFDVFLCNPDRRIDNPNFFLQNEKIILYDHDSAFGFVYDLIQKTEEFPLIDELDKRWIQNHQHKGQMST